MFNKLHLPLGKFGKASESKESKDKVPSPRTKDARERDNGKDTKESKDSKSPKGISALLSPKKATTDARGEETQSLLQLVQSGMLDQLKKILQTGSGNLDEKHSISGQSPLHVAAAEGRVDIAKVLIQHKADTRAKDTWGFTPLHVALLNNHFPMSLFLIKKGADVNAVTEKKMSPLHFAARANYEWVEDASNSTTRRWKRVSSTRKLDEQQQPQQPQQQGSSITPSTPSGSMIGGSTARFLQERDYLAYLSVLDQLVRRGADVNARNENLETPLYHAAFNARELGLVFLLLNGADPNLPSKEGMTPLHVACSSGKLPLVQALLNYGSDPSIRTSQGSPLEEAEKTNNREVVALIFARSGLTEETGDKRISGNKLDEVAAQVARAEKTVVEFLSSVPVSEHEAHPEKEGSSFKMNWKQFWKRHRAPSDPPPPEPGVLTASGSNNFPKTRPVSVVVAEEKKDTPKVLKEIKAGEEAETLSEALSTPNPSEQFIIETPLGEGAYGQVFSARHKDTGFVVAVKSMIMNPKLKKGIEKEIKILSRCRHPNIVQYYGSYFKQGNIYVIMEFCVAGSALDFQKVVGRPFTEHEVSAFFNEVLKGLTYLHKNHFIHRDLKPQNILVNGQGIPKIADFGVSRELDQGQLGVTIIGTPLYSSPEVLEGEPYYSADIWSLGITILHFVEGNPPYHDKQLMAAIMAIASNPPPLLQEPEKWSPAFNDFMTKCLQREPASRMKGEELLQHSFIQDLPISHDKILQSLVTEYKGKHKPTESTSSEQHM